MELHYPLYGHWFKKVVYIANKKSNLKRENTKLYYLSLPFAEGGAL